MKKLITLALLLAFSCSLLAERVDYQKASNVAATVLQNKELTLIPLKSWENLYVFNAEKGFVIVSADDCARPVLAYSLEYSFKTEHMPEHIQGWLASLNAEIQHAVDMKLEATEEIRREWELLSLGKMPEPKHRSEVKPLVVTHWDQYEPYNNLCPEYSLTGCVATAMAQIMKYWEWPNKGTGSHSYTHNTYGELSVNFGNATYDWDNMVGEVFYDSPEVQQTAVATLMYHCGVSVDMDYSPSGSAAYTDRVGEALYTYFDYYQNDMRWEYASNYDADSWVALLKTELDMGRPILYRGQGDGGGHAFVCDGYDTDDYLHFNWGWGGYCDGYYAYGALAPGAGGAGSGAGVYNDENSITCGIHPNTSPVTTPHGLSASVSDRTVTLQWTPVSGINRYKVYRDGFVINTNVSGASYTDTNVFYGDHTYYVKAVNANGVCSMRSQELLVDVSYSGPVVTNLTANVQSHDVHLSWTAPANESAQLKYGDGEAYSGSIGNPYGTGFYWGQRYTPQQLASYAGMAITSVEFFSWKVTDYTLLIYKEVDGEMEQIATKSFSNTASGWYTVNLSTPVPIDYENNLIVAFYNDCSEYQYMAACTDYEGSGNARLYFEDGYWYQIDDAISWLIKTNITDGTYTYSIYRNEQQIATNISQTNYSDTDLPNGYYQYTVRTKYYGMLSDHSNIEPAIVGPNIYAVTVVSVTEPECNGGDDGAVSVDVIGGFMPLTVELGSQSATVSDGHYTFQNVSAGVYSLKVTDNLGYEIVTSVTVGEPEGLSAGEISSGSESIANGGTCSPILSVHDATSGQATLTYRWKQNGTVIENSNMAQYTPKNLQPGTYNFTREVMDACTDWTPSDGKWRVLVSQNAVDENDAARLEVYPNPTSGKVTVRCEHMVSVTVVSMAGQRLTTVEVTDGHVDVDLADFRPGVYVMEIRTHDGLGRVRVVRD